MCLRGKVIAYYVVSRGTNMLDSELDDMYQSELREGLKRSMSEPAKMRPLYSRRATDTTPVGARRDRRHRKLLRFYYHLTDDLGAFLWLIVALIVSVGAWVAIAQVLGWFR